MAIDWYNGRLDVDDLPIQIKEDIIEKYSDRVYQDLTPDLIEKIIAAHNLHNMTPDQVFRDWLEYEGIIGYTNLLQVLIDHIVHRAMKIHPSCI